MREEKFGVAVGKEIVQEVDELVAKCDDLGASRSELVEAVLTAFVQSESNHTERVREIMIRKGKTPYDSSIPCTKCTTIQASNAP